MSWWEKFCRRHRGSISIFLSIILLPVLWVIGLLVDSTNYNLSKGVVEGAGEMAANAALANYDTVLADVYGLFAMSQDQQDLGKNLEHYFQDTLQASGLFTQNELDDLKSVSKTVKPMFINLEYDDFTASGLDNSSLANPDVLKNQVVEFMKYRGPAEVGMSLLDSLGVFQKVGAQSEVVKAKVKADEDVASLAEESQRLYQAIEELDELIRSYLIAKAKFYGENGGSSDLSLIGQHLHKATTIVENHLMDVLDSGDLLKMTAEEAERQVPSADPEAGPTIQKVIITKVHGVSKDSLPSSPDSHATHEERVAMVVQDLSHDLGELEKQVNHLGASVAGALSPDVAVQDLNRIYKDYSLYFSPIVEAVYGQYLLIQDENTSGNYDRDLEKTEEMLNKARTEVNEPLVKFVQEYEAEMDKYRKQVGEHVRSAITLLNRYGGDLEALYEAEAVPEGFWEKLRDILDVLGSALMMVDKQVDRVESAMIKAQKSTEALDADVKKYEKERTSNGDEFSTNIKSEVERNKKIFTLDDLREIKSQVGAIRCYLCIENYEVNCCTLYGKQLFGMTLSNDDVDAGKQIVKLREKFTGTPFYSLMTSATPMVQNCYIRCFSDGPTTLSDGTIVSTSPYYKYMKCNYFEEPKGDDKNKKQVEKVTEVVNKKAEEETDKDKGGTAPGAKAQDGSAFSNCPSGAVGNNADQISFELGKGNTAILGQLGSILKLVGSLATDTTRFGEDARDNMLVTQYVESNFSCATSGKDQDANKETMTNVAINTANNPLMGCEMEYAIYGNKGDQAKKIFFIKLAEAPGPAINITYAKSNILAVRMACNSIYAIGSRDLNNETIIPAMSIQAATAGVFPYKVAQTVLDVCLAYAESLSDLSRLMEGEKVELLKSKNTWTMAPSEIMNAENVRATVDLMIKKYDYIGTNHIQNMIDGSADWANERIDELSGDVSVELDAAIDTGVEEIKDTISALVLDKMEGLLMEEINKGTEVSQNQVRAALEEATAPYIEKLGSSPLRNIAEKLRSSLIEKVSGDSGLLAGLKVGTAEGVQDFREKLDCTVNNHMQQLVAKMENEISAVTDPVISAVKGKISALTSTVKGAAADKIGEASQQAGEELSQMVNKELGTLFPNKNESVKLNKRMQTKSAGVGEMFKFSYRDYLRLFLFLELNKDSDSAMMRLADLIQINVGEGMADYAGKGEGKAHLKGSQFRMNKAFTYVDIQADMQMKPILLSQRLFSWDNNLTRGRWKYHFETVRGY